MLDNVILGLRDPTLDDSELKAKFIFTKEQVQELIDRTKVKLGDSLGRLPERKRDIPIVFDKKLLDIVVEKQRYIKVLQSGLQEIKERTHNIEDITKYIEACKAIENYDLNKEIKQAT